MIVGAHPQIAVPFATTGMWFDFHDQLDRYSDIKDYEHLQHLVEDILAHDRVQLWDAALDASAILNRSRPNDFPSVVAATHAAYATAKGKERWANIDIANLDSMHMLNDWFPDAKFLHIVRDGRDVALSHQTMPYGSGNIAECAEAWERRITINLRVGHVLGPSRYAVVRYEDLILEPENALAKVCRFLEVEFSPEMIHYQQMVAEKVPEDRKWLWPALDKQLDRTKVGRWRHSMSKNQRAVFESIAGDLLRKLDYEALDEIPVSTGRLALELAYFLDRGARIKRLKRRLGLSPKSKLERAGQKSRAPN